MGVYELSGAGSVKTGRTLYTSMNAGNMYGAMVPIASQTVTSTTYQIAFNNIPQTFQDLFLVCTLRTDNASRSDGTSLGVSGAGSTDFSYTELWGTGSSANSARGSNTSVILARTGSVAATSASGIYSAVNWHILNYTSTTTFKTFLGRTASDSNGDGATELAVGLYRSLNPLTSFSVFGWNGSYVAGSTATLYGIRAVSS